MSAEFGDLLDRPAHEAVRRIALQLLESATGASDRLSDPTDHEALHDFRVALRRFRSFARAYGEVLGDDVPRKLLRTIRDLARSTNEGRDAEVLLEWVNQQRVELSPLEKAGADKFANVLGERTEHAYAIARSKIAREFRAIEYKLRPRLARYSVEVNLMETEAPPTFAIVATEVIRSHSNDLNKQLALVTDQTKKEQAHDARLAGKRLRYLLEPLCEAVVGLAPVVTSLRELQELLGRMHDVQVASIELGHAVETFAAERAREEHQVALRRKGGSRKARHVQDAQPGLLALTRVAASEAQGCYRELQAHWLDGQSAEFFQGLNLQLDELRDRRAAGIEIERKYLLSGLPEITASARVVTFDQGYLPGDRIRDRVRRVKEGLSETYIRTIKAGAGLSRLEIEEETSKEVFRGLWALTRGARLKKRRYYVADGAQTWEIDEFLDRELFLAEIELRSVDEKVVVPDWLAPFVVREVTDESTYTNINLAQ